MEVSRLGVSHAALQLGHASEGRTDGGSLCIVCQLTARMVPGAMVDGMILRVLFGTSRSAPDGVQSGNEREFHYAIVPPVAMMRYWSHLTRPFQSIQQALREHLPTGFFDGSITANATRFHI